MPTVAQMITRSLRLIEALGAGETPTTDEYADALYVYNSMIDSWNNERLMLYYTEELTETLVNGDQTYTVGPAGDINATRPLAITGAFVVDNDIRYPVEIINKDAWDSIFDVTTTSSYPNFLFYDPQYPLGVINLFPVPSTTCTLHVDAKKQLTSFASTGTSLALPPGYQAMIEYNGAIWLAPEWGKAVKPEVAEIAAKTMKVVKATNLPDLTMRIPPITHGGTRSNIFSG
jgi:hypothetical protein